MINQVSRCLHRGKKYPDKQHGVCPQFAKLKIKRGEVRIRKVMPLFSISAGCQPWVISVSVFVC